MRIIVAAEKQRSADELTKNVANRVAEQICGATCERFELATVVGLDPTGAFPSADLKPFCSLSCSFE
jgi:hypothetical protein